MGLFLQKTNIIRDYLADIKEGRKFWPKEVNYNCNDDLNIQYYLGIIFIRSKFGCIGHYMRSSIKLYHSFLNRVGRNSQKILRIFSTKKIWMMP